MCSNRFCWRSGRIKGQVPTCARCPDCWTWRHEVRPFGWCWRMQSSTRNPTTNTSDNAWEPKASSPPSAEVFPKAPFGIKCSAPFRKNRTANAPRSNHLLGDQTQAFLPRSRAQLIYTDSPSPAARSCLQPLSLEASPHLEGCQQSHQHLQKCIKTKDFNCLQNQH